ncbi:MAG: hypothetical protein RSD68_05065 [Oscillospiraceae bacterium]
MDWTKEKIEKLQGMCFAGTSNADMAREFGVPVTQIYAKRSQLGLTIDKCKEVDYRTAVNEPVKVPKKLPVGKAKFIFALEILLHMADKDIVSLELSEDESFITVVFAGEWKRRANIEADSLIAIIKDVVRAVG